MPLASPLASLNSASLFAGLILWQGFDMPLYPMPRNLNRSEKTAFLKKRIADTEHLMSGTVQFVEKNYQLFSQKLETLNQLRRQRSTSPNWLTGPSEREQKLSRLSRAPAECGAMQQMD